MDRGIWASWYDLPDEKREAYCAWLHGDCLPAMLRRGGFLWAAHYEITGGGAQMERVKADALSYAEGGEVPSGTRFLLLFGAASPHVFFQPTIDEIEKEQSAEARAMLGLRVGLRACVFSEEARVEGPDADARGPGITPGPAIQMGQFLAEDAAAEHDLGAWYAQYRLRFMERMPGCIGARKLLSAAGWAKHSILYEFTSLEARHEGFQAHESLSLDESQWSGRVVRKLIHAPGSPSVGRRLWPPANGGRAAERGDAHGATADSDG